MATALAEEFRRSGITHACVSPGSRSAPLARALWLESGIEVVTQVDERSSGFFALGLALASGRATIVLTTSGTAAANLYPAVIEADRARVPMVVLTADRPPELLDIGANQTIDQTKLFGDRVRWYSNAGILDADDTGLAFMRSWADHAVSKALGPPAGPVHLNIPLREPLAPEPIPEDVPALDSISIRGRGGGRPVTTVIKGRRTVDDRTQALPASLVNAHETGVVVAGRQLDPRLAESVATFAQAAGYPILADPLSQIRCGTHRLDSVVAGYDLILRDPPDRLEPAFVVRVGDMPTSKALRTWLGRTTAVQLVFDPDGAWQEPTRHADYVVEACPADALSRASARVHRGEGPWVADWMAADARVTAETERFFDEVGDEMFEPKLVAALGAKLPSGGTVFAGSSMPVRDVEGFFPRRPVSMRFLANRGASGIDGLVSTALGASEAVGSVHALVGDLGFYHDMNGLLATRRPSVDATFIVINNNGGGIFSYLPVAGHREGWDELFATPTGINPADVAATYGLPYVKLSAYSQLDEAVGFGGVVEVPVDAHRSVTLHKALFERASGAVRS